MANGDRLPSFQDLGNETVEQYIHKMHRKKDTPLHQSHTSSATLVAPWSQAPDTDHHINNSNWFSMDAERTEKKNVRYDPIARPDPHVTRAPSQGKPYVDVPPRPQPNPPKVLAPTPAPNRKDETETTKAKPFTPSNPPTILKQMAEPRPPLAHKKGMNNLPDEDIEMVDDSGDKTKNQEKVYIPRNPPKMQFTTDLRQKVNICQVMDQLYEQEVKLPLGVVLGISGEVSKEFNNATRTHKDYVGKANRAQVVQTYDETDESDYHLDLDDETDPEEWPDSSYGFMSQTVDVGDVKHNLEPALLAMGTGRLIVKVGAAEQVSAMIDTGSEICLISRRIQEALV
ncbi:hypothetical protein BS47DRAFT_1392069 [Hydnum rufescens UP504]|uniref:DUF4100 domain-containing protein n=1 Tax=Hydnum rufescens UP504 TaxID=1448309 RepID=A0A9P6DXP2_9AGAM|nr:hypothetical protein BS47DRAFT_1392069 [Hydnum rufescens UP504]